MLSLNRDLCSEFTQNKFAIAKAEDFNLNGHFDEFYAFCRSWENLGHDPHFGQQKEGTRYRHYSDFEYDPVSKSLTQMEHDAYEQLGLKNQVQHVS